MRKAISCKFVNNDKNLVFPNFAIIIHLKIFLVSFQVFYRVAMAIILLFYKHSSLQNSEWMNEISKNGVDVALSKFIRQIPVSNSIEMRFPA